MAPLLIVSLLAASMVTAQTSQPPASSNDLFQTIAALDTALFASANYDSCDIEKFKSFFADDVEFYHDQNGPTFSSETVAAQVKKNLCGVVRRRLVAGSMKVYPMRGYGAVQMGVHRFYQPKMGTEPTGEAQFIHLWQQKDGVWKLKRVISYDHVSLVKK